MHRFFKIATENAILWGQLR